jgi:hypothetical protein
MLHSQITPDADALRRKVDTAWELTHAGRYTELTELLRALVPTR